MVARQVARTAFLAGFDTEDDGEGHPFLWCVTHGEGTWWTDQAPEFLRYLEKLGDRKWDQAQRLQLWATNLEYDLCNVFDTSSISQVRLRFGRSALCGASWKRADFRDTMRHLPASVASLGEMVGLPKRERTLFTAPRRDRIAIRRYLRRCQRDATITYRAAAMFQDTYQDLGERARMTLASTALNLWKEKFWKRGIGRPDSDVWQAALDAYHGGRTQAFYVGTFPDVKVIDAASMFPWAMTAAPLPLPWGLYREVGPNAKLQAHGVYLVDVTSHLPLPLLPMRGPSGTVYPAGRWRGWYVGEELQVFHAAGGRITIQRGYEFGEQCEPFTGYVDKLFALKNASRGGKRALYKLLLNSLYGKFGQQGRKVVCCSIEKMLAMNNPPVSWRPWMGLAIFSEEGPPPPWSNNVWCAFITARARVRLWQTMLRIKQQGCRVLYCDTDSVFYQGGARFPAKAKSPGDFETRGNYRQVLIVGKKEYALKIGPKSWEPYVKGIPLAERLKYLETGRADFQRPTRIRESSRDNSQVNVWRKITKERRTDLRRSARSDGSLPTPQMRGGKLSGTRLHRGEKGTGPGNPAANRSRKGARSGIGKARIQKASTR